MSEEREDKTIYKVVLTTKSIFDSAADRENALAGTMRQDRPKQEACYIKKVDRHAPSECA